MSVREIMRDSVARAAPAAVSIAVGVLVGLTILELGTRLLLPDVVPRPDHQKLLMQHHPRLGWEKIPGAKKSYLREEFSIVEHINSKGLRGPEYAYERADRTSLRRVLLLGDSFVEGYSVDFEDLVSHLLEAELDASPVGGFEWQVINGGTAGYSTDQELLFYREEGRKYEPDLTVLFFYDNDIWYNDRSRHGRGYKPVFSVEDETLVLSNVPVPEPDVLERPPFFSNPGLRTRIWLMEHSASYRLVRNALVGPSKAQDGEEEQVPLDVRPYARNHDEDMEAAWEITDRLLRTLRDDVQRDGSEFLVFYVPPRGLIYADDWQRALERFALSPGDWNVDAVRSRLRSICAAASIAFLDPTAHFRAQAEAGSEQARLYYRRDLHWTPDGNRLAAGIVARHIAEGSTRGPVAQRRALVPSRSSKPGSKTQLPPPPVSSQPPSR